MKIPRDFRWLQANTSDLFGSIFATKNINFDEEGYVKLSSRAVSVFSEETDGDFGVPLAIGRKDEDDFLIVTDDEPFDATISTTSISVTEEAGANNPTLSGNSWGTWWQNRWHVTEDADLHYKSGATWTDVAVTLTASVPHPMEVFRNRNSLCIANGNVVKQYDTSYTETTNLTIPADFNVIGMAYSNAKMGIVTKLSPDVAGQNQDAFFFVWDGSSTSAGQGVPIGSDMAAGVVAYKGSWLVLTRTGELLYWNGGGFTQVAAFPFYFRNLVWGDFLNRVGKGLNMQVEGDVVYINVDLTLDQYGQNLTDNLPYCPSGIWCFDPKVGLYHKYSPSQSTMSVINVLQAGVNTTTNVITANTGTIPTTGNVLRYVTADGSTVIGGLLLRRDYYVIKLTSTTFSLAESKELAEAGVAIDLTSQGGATHNFLAFDLLDYGASIVNDAGAVALMGIQSPAYDHIVFGVELRDYESTGDFNLLNVTVGNLENRGYVILPLIQAAEAEDSYESIIIPHRPLKEGDEIIVKTKTEELLGLPLSSSQNLTRCSWTGASAFYTTVDLSDAKTAFDAGKELECEVLSGAGAGSMSKITDISYSAGTYSVTLEDSIQGAASGRYCDVLIDNWEVAHKATYSQNNGLNYLECPLGEVGQLLLLKIELRGVETAMRPFTLKRKARK